MATEVKRRRGTTAEHGSFTGAVAEITVNTSKNTAVVHDGSTAGGFELSRADLDNVSGIPNSKLANSSVTVTAGSGLGGGGSVALGASTSLTADVTTVHGRTGAVVAVNGDYTATNITNAPAGDIAAVTVQAALDELDGDKLALAGGTMAGALTLSGAPTVDLHAATKAYVDSVISGLDTKESVRAATTADITLSGNQTIDGVSTVDGDRVLVKEQSDLTENGIYVTDSGAWSRSADADNTPGAEIGPGMFTFVEEGSTEANNGFVAFGTTTGAGALEGYFNLGVDDIEFSQFSGAGQITAGTNLNKSGNTMNLDTTLTNFASTGIDDNATSIAITIDSNEQVLINGTTSHDASGKLFIADNAVSNFGQLILGNTGGSAWMIGRDNTSTGDFKIGELTNTSDTVPTEPFRIEASTGFVGIGITAATSPDGTLHVHTATAGSVTANANADDLVIENTGTTGMSFLSPAAQNQHIYFGDETDNDIGRITYQHGDNSMVFTTDNTTALSMSSSQVVNINSASSIGQFNVKGSGTTSASFSRDDNFGDSTQNVLIHVGNSGSEQGNLRIHYFNNTSVAGQLGKIEFNPRNAADDGQDTGGSILFTKDTDLSGTIKFAAPNNSGGETAVLLDGDDVVFSSNTSGLVGLGRTGQRWKDLWLTNSNNTNPLISMLASSDSYNNGELLQIKTNTVANTNSFFIECETDTNGSPDLEFRVRFDGEVTADGSFTGGGADYADYFEWADGNPDNEDRVGFSVVSTADGKIRLAEMGEQPFGVISGKPAATGNAASNRWDSKYLRDDFNRYALDDNGERMLNPAFEQGMEYIPREERPEWDAVGLVGRLPVRKGQEISDTWVKLSDISDAVEEWLVK